ncbi:uncharacterized protein LOC118266298 [Spodoptera frugiperda]|uniref:Uncharacterized protein LOC118266298 n=1 Tax=Spodoptera frugiperda TaxID=7108 RepID=A0A9R0D033_SPOFR|nr:uncharacterized protein LOC118266298 [Spodoptera frugiperda]
MSFQRTRPIDALQRIMTSFKHFEKKLDKLQNDVKTHGQTLSDLRNMVTTLSAGTLASADGKTDDNWRPGRKTTAIQHDEKPSVDTITKSRRKNAIQPLPNKLKAKNMANQKTKTPVISPIKVRVHNCTDVNTKDVGCVGSKHTERLRKVEAPRKATIIRSQKAIENKRSKMAK